MLTISDVDNLARLARIELSEEEKIKLQKDMESILGYISQLSEVDTTSTKETQSEYALVNVMREDASPHNPDEYKAAILSNAPNKNGDYFAVKAIFEDR